MAHYAFLDDNNVVTEVIVGRNEDETVDGISDWEAFYGELRGQRCVRTSYNHRIRVRFANIGYTYDEQRDAFIPPQPFKSWSLDESTLDWVAPIPRPQIDGPLGWDEDNQTWITWSEEAQDWVPVA